MTGDAERSKKIRIRIERDAYPALLSFKGGATSLQVEERINALFDLSYADKYHLAGVENMHQILMEHPEIRQRRDGKFEIIANNDNEDLVALVSKQKDRMGSRARSCIGYRHKHSPRAYSRLSPKPFRMKRPLTAGIKKHTHKTAPNLSQSFSAGYNHSYISSAANDSHNSIKPHRTRPVKNYIEPVQQQRPLVRPKTTTSIVPNSLLPSNSHPVTKKIQPIINDPPVTKKIQSIDNTEPVTQTSSVSVSEQMPSIKQFSQNVKLMMMKAHPSFIPLSDMTKYYFQEYNVLIDPSKLYSKPWKMLLKTTFKDWVQVNGDEVTLKKKSTKQGFAESVNLDDTRDMSFNTTQRSEYSFYNEEKDLNISIPQSISPSEIMIRQMQDLKIGSLKKPPPEKPPGSLTQNVGSTLNPIIKFLVGGKGKAPSKQTLRSCGPFTQVLRMDSENRTYDSKSLYAIKRMHIDEKLKIYVSAALNEVPRVKRRQTEAFNRSTETQKYCRASHRKFPVNKSLPPPKDLSALIFDTSADSTYSNSPSSLSPPDSKPVRMRLDNNPVQIAKTNKDADSLYILSSENLGINLYKKAKNTCLSRNADFYATECASSSSSGTIQNSSSSSTSRKLMLPPMSKGAISRTEQRLQPNSCIPTTASSSNSSVCIRELRGRATDDDW